MTEPLWSDQRIEKSTYSDSTVEKLKLMRNEYEAELEKARTELAAANLRIAELTDDLTEAAQVADADNATVAALVSRIEDEKVTALRTELAAANAKVALLYSELEIAHGINHKLIETITDLDAKLTERGE